MKNKTILVTGGRGYIGSHAVLQLKEAGYDVVVVDDLSRSLPGNEIEGVKYYDIQMQDREGMNKLLSENNIYAVMHFAAFISVFESTQNPGIYFKNNTEGVKVLLEILESHGIDKFIFSSTAATYGEGNGEPLSEESPTIPVNPYGESKLQAEKLLQNTKMKYVIFRYFNVAGADELLRSGANLKDKPTHLIGSINIVALGQSNNKFSIYGDDYETKDGTCVRDYIHVVDLVSAHVKALELLENDTHEIINLGTGEGFTVKEVFEDAEDVLGMEIPHDITGRREGDPAKLTSDNKKALTILGWKPEKSLDLMIKSDYEWRKKNA